ncbi:MAG: hypothetical protein NTX05_01555 [Fusobacteria bacterium]|nr:hypothetical protein [Fusobacteriota bacterium]
MNLKQFEWLKFSNIIIFPHYSEFTEQNSNLENGLQKLNIEMA